MGIHVRLDVLPDIALPVDEIIRYADARRHIVAREDPGGNPHVHIYLDTDRTKNDVRNYITRRHPQWQKDKKCVKQWGDERADLRYFCKGDKVTHKMHIMTSTFAFNELATFRDEYYENYTAKAGTTLTAALTQRCRVKGIKSYHDVIEEFILMRKGTDGICEFKHGPAVRSAWLALNGESETVDVVNRFVQKIFM